MDILGVSCYYHDAAAVLLRDGQLVAAAEEERFSRIKHDYGFPKQAIQFCLEPGRNHAARDLDYVVFFEKPFRKLDRILMTSAADLPEVLEGLPRVDDHLDAGQALGGKHAAIGAGMCRNSKVLFSDHHLSHAASAFLCSPFEEAAILTVDGVGEWVTATYGVGQGNDIRLTKQIEFPHSVGLLYSAFTAFLGFEVNEGEYKVMGMAPLWPAALRGQGVEAGPAEPRRLLFAGHGLLLLPPFHGPDVQPDNLWSCSASRARQKSISSRHGTGFPNTLGSRPRTTTSCAGQPALCGHRRQHPESDGRTADGHGQESSQADRAEAAVHRRRRGLEQRGQHPHSCARRRSRNFTSSLPPATAAAPWAPHCGPTTLLLGKPRNFSDGPRLLGRRNSDGGNQ